MLYYLWQKNKLLILAKSDCTVNCLLKRWWVAFSVYSSGGTMYESPDFQTFQLVLQIVKFWVFHTYYSYHDKVLIFYFYLLSLTSLLLMISEATETVDAMWLPSLSSQVTKLNRLDYLYISVFIKWRIIDVTRFHSIIVGNYNV